MKLWGIIKKNHKITNDMIVEIDETLSEEALVSALKEICVDFDICVPVILSKHTGELTKFNRTVFKAVDFIEPIKFDTFEIEIFDKKKKDE